MWTPKRGKQFGVAIYNWPGEIKYGLPLEIGDTVQIFEECLGWYRGFVTKNRSIKGIFPCNYIHLKPCRVENQGMFETAIPLEDPVVREVTLVLREWSYLWKSLYVERETYKFVTLRKVMGELLDWRRQLLTGTLTLDQTKELKLRITSKIDWGNRKLGLDLVPRCGAEMVDSSNMSVVELYHVHLQNTESASLCSSHQTYCVTTLSKIGFKRPTPKVLTYHIYLRTREFCYFVGEDIEIYFSLYDAKKMKFLSERFLVRISKEGFSNYLPKVHDNSTVFTDLGSSDLNKDLYIVAHVMRIGKILHSESGKKLTATLSNSSQNSNCSFKRPFGVGVLNIGAELTESTGYRLNDTDEKEYSFKVFTCEDKEFYQLHECIIRKQNSKFSPLSNQQHYGGTGIDIAVKLYEGTFEKVAEENPHRFKNKNITLTRKMGYPDVIMPGDVRNDWYITLERAEFERGGKSTGKNIEVTVLVFDDENNLIENCLYGASNVEGNSEYRSMVIYHHNSPCWCETIRLRIPLADEYKLAHVRFEYRHCSNRDKSDNKKPIGFSFARLMDLECAVLQEDGCHELFVYRFDEKIKLDPSFYLMLPSNSVDVNRGYKVENNPLFTTSHKESMHIQTFLCSTKFTQNVDLLNLLRWREHPTPEHTHDALVKALSLKGEELVKFLQDTLDALFSMFSTEEGNSTKYSGGVFHVLSGICHLLFDSKFEHFRPVMDAYIKDHFAAPLVWRGLLTSIQHTAERVTQTDNQIPIKTCFRSLEYFFKLIIRSKSLFCNGFSSELHQDSFKCDVYAVFNAFNRMLNTSNEKILPTQVTLLHSISVVFDLLMKTLSPIETATLAVKMIESLPAREPPPELIQAKLVLIRDIVSSDLFKTNEARTLLLANSCRHVRFHLQRRDELRLCMDILSEILSFLFHLSRSPKTTGRNIIGLHHEVEIVCLSSLDMLIQTVLLIMDRSAPILGCLVANLVGLLQLLTAQHYEKLWEQLNDRKPLKDFLLRIFLVFRNLTKQDVFPSDWLVMKMKVNSVLLSSLQQITQPLKAKFLESWQFDGQIWGTYFNLAVEFLTQPSLQLEKFSEVKRGKIIEKYGDMRVLMGRQILSVWSELGEHKVNFVPTMVGPFLEVTLVPEPELRRSTLNIFFDMMQTEERIRGNFKAVETELIEKLDQLINENKGDDEYPQLFNTILLERIKKEDPKWRETGSAFINSVTRLLERLLDYRSVIQGDENRDKRMSCTVNLLNFYKNEIGRKEMYLRYIFKLHDLHYPADNFTEAGFTLKLYADSLRWDSTSSLPHDHRANDVPEWKRKEELYHQIISYFDKGKCWEKGIPLCKELANLYEKQLFDYVKLSEILRTQARFCDNILNQLRLEPEYFRVGFYGLSFPLFVRNKVFVYRGLEYERVETFTQRMQTEFPSAQILTKNSPPSHAILQSDPQFIQICYVKPIPESGPPSDGVPLASVPSRVARFYQVNDVSKFFLDRPMHRGTIDKENEFKTLWLERTTMTISSSLPGILRWFEVVHSNVEEIPPVRFACETMETVNAELRKLIAVYCTDPKRSIHPLTMRLQGTIDANVMGGISKYQQAFFTTEFLQNEPSYLRFVQQLNALIIDQVSILDEGLDTHGKLAPPEVKPLHQRLVERHAHFKQSLKKPAIPLLLDSIQNSPLPSLPVNDREPDPYTNAIGYGRLCKPIEDRDDLYSKVSEYAIEEFNFCSRPIDHDSESCSHLRNLEILPRRDVIDGRTSLPRLPSKHGSARSSYRLSIESSSTCTVGNNDEAPPLPPRLNMDRRSVSDVPPTPPKRASLRKDSESAIGDITHSVNRLLRDSGFSESAALSSSYDDFVLVPPVNAVGNSFYTGTPPPPPIPLLSPRSTEPSSDIPPPLPPKVLASVVDDEDGKSNHEKERARSQYVENYSVPKLQINENVDLR